MILSKLPLLLILACAAFFRLYAIDWGVPSVLLPHAPFHPDETWVMQVVAQIDPGAWDWNPEEGHREGTLSYFIWALLFCCLKVLGIISRFPYPGQPFDADYATCLYSARLLVAACDVVSVLFVYLVTARITGSRLAGYISAITLACLPYELIHAHFMRGHVIANTLLMMALYLAVCISERNKWRYVFGSGIAVGLSAATRYPMALSGIIPFWFLARTEKWWQVLLEQKVRGLIFVCRRSAAPVLIMSSAAAFFSGVPFLLLDYSSAKPHLAVQATYVADNQFGGYAFFDLSRVWVYVAHLIPYGTLPYLWVALYISMAYLLVQKRWHGMLFPLHVFCIIYLYSMAKGYYATPIFIRAALPIFPVLSVMVGVAVYDVLTRLKVSAIRYAVITCISFVIISAFMYDIAYLKVMKNDSRIQLAQQLSDVADKPTISLGLYKHRHNYFMVTPTLSVLAAPKIDLTEQESFAGGAYKKHDFILNTAFEVSDYVKFDQVNKWLKSRGHTLIKDFSPKVEFLGVSFARFSHLPHDLLYPLPRIALWKVNRRNG
jgi:4-amino-4-deoxy-L-arabinose transferase-like glycosyltransferase